MIIEILRRSIRLLARLEVAAVLVLALLLVAAVGSFFPQRPQETAGAGQLAEWDAAARARYGPRTDLLAASGAFGWYRSPGFVALASLLALATLVCTLDRWARVWRRAAHQPVRCSEAALDRAPYTARIDTSPECVAAHAARDALRRRGFAVRSDATGNVTHLRGDRNRLSPVGTLVTHLALLLLLAGAVTSSAFGWRTEITAGPGETVEVGRGSGLALRNEGFAVERYADGSAAGYEARLAVIEGAAVAHGSTRVNEPLSAAGVSLVLTGYEWAGESHRVTLVAVRDPGFGLVVAGGLLLLLGLTVSLNLPHARVFARIEPGRLRLAGRADRRAWEFGREFAEIVSEIEQCSPMDTHCSGSH